MGDDVPSVVALLSQKSSLLLLQESRHNPAMVEVVLGRLTETVNEWEEKGVSLDPVQFEIITDLLVKQFAASHMAMQSIVARCTCGALSPDTSQGANDEADDHDVTSE